MIINKKSWHYALVKQFHKNRLIWADELDSCSYINLVLLSILISLAIVVFASAMLNTFVLLPIIYAIVCYNHGFFLDVETIIPPAVLLVGSIIIYCIYLYNEHQVKLVPSFVSQAHHRIKNKYCTKLEIIGD